MNWRAVTSSIVDMAARTFGEPVTYLRAGEAQPITLRGIFQSAHIEIDPISRADVLTYEPRVDFRRQDLDFEPSQDDTLVIAGVTYGIQEKHYDGWAKIRLILMEV